MKQQQQHRLGKLGATLILSSVSLQVMAATQAPSLTLNEYVSLVNGSNENIRYQMLEKEISGAAVENANSIFEMQLVGKASRGSIQMLNTTEEKAGRAFRNTYESDVNAWEIGVEKLLATGAKLSVSYNLQDITNNLQTEEVKGKEFKSFMGLTIDQPLLRNAGIDVTNANIRIADSDYEIAGHSTRQVQLEYVAHAAAAYLDVQLAQAKLSLGQEGVTIVETLLHDSRQRYNEGKEAKGDVLLLEARLASRQAQLAADRVTLVSRYNEALDLLATSTHEQGFFIDEKLSAPAFVEPDTDEILKNTLKLRPEYLAAKKKAEQEGMRVSYSENQMLPELNLRLEYGRNGLGANDGKSVTDMFHPEDDINDNWKVGLEFRMPLSGNKKANSEYRAALLRKQQMEVRISALHAALKNVINASVKQLKNSHQQYVKLQQVVERQKQLVEFERARYQEGKVSGQEVFEAEDEMNKEQLALLDNLVQYRKAIIGLQLAQGSLLQSFSLEPQTL